MTTKLSNISLKFFILLFCMFCFSACFKEAFYPNTPTVKFNKYDLENNAYQYNSSKGSLIVDFTDGDGDLGVVYKDTLIIVGTDTIKKIPISGKVYYTIPKYDSIRNYVIDEYAFPEISSAYNGSKNGILEIKFTSIFDEVKYSKITNSFPGIQRDTINFKLWMKDRAGNQSNIITTPDFIINYN
ncbi:MAG TPA: hypothetical protein PLW92_11565 [Chitinophagales bacterium]|nr:hypothetical protein [Chitinophagales bacterium]